MKTATILFGEVRDSGEAMTFLGHDEFYETAREWYDGCHYDHPRPPTREQLDANECSACGVIIDGTLTITTDADGELVISRAS